MKPSLLLFLEGAPSFEPLTTGEGSSPVLTWLGLGAEILRERQELLKFAVGIAQCPTLTLRPRGTRTLQEASLKWGEAAEPSESSSAPPRVLSLWA